MSTSSGEERDSVMSRAGWSSIREVPATDEPCPDWCGLRDNHPWTGYPGQDHLERTHSRTFLGTDRSGAFVDMAACENGRLWKHETERTDVEISVESWVGDGPGARRLAAALLNAADAWDAAHRGLAPNEGGPPVLTPRSDAQGGH